MITFFVEGEPKSQGSKRAFVNRKTGRAVMVEMVKNKDWRKLVAEAAKVAMRDAKDAPWRGGVSVQMTFFFLRPKAHYIGKTGELRVEAPVYKTSKPDGDKLARCVLVSLTGNVFVDDAQVISLRVIKQYVDHPVQGVRITVERV